MLNNAWCSQIIAIVGQTVWNKDTMQIILNGNVKNVSDGLTTAGLLDDLELQDQRIAVEVNLELVVRSSFATHELQDGDCVEIIQAIGGG